MSPNAKLLSEDADNDNGYSGLFEAYGLRFTVVHSDGAFVPRAAPDNPKKPNWLVEAAVRLCQSAAYERVQAIKRGEK
jgi:hypothetical protein